MQKTEVVLVKHIPCPNCGKLFGVDHLNPGKYTWFCYDCDHYFKIDYDGNEYLTKVDSKKEMTTLVLKLKQHLPLYLIYPYFKNKGDDYQYHIYNNCPINFIRYTEDVVIGSDFESDYHNAFELVFEDDRKYNRNNVNKIIDRLRATVLLST